MLAVGGRNALHPGRWEDHWLHHPIQNYVDQITHEQHYSLRRFQERTTTRFRSKKDLSQCKLNPESKAVGLVTSEFLSHTRLHSSLFWRFT
ncbi:hypothetical protein C4D60_Mb04t03120 [Musa balbisiana]|uniref:Uncharacterized protein n=1 Tax=Musa balbisiana TaxID=52838 RepID=A0A4S8K993_MUSBA|nr:hypothetical protein C4D60_Mb04t03120 [Musa balbisiana]